MNYLGKHHNMTTLATNLVIENQTADSVRLIAESKDAGTLCKVQCSVQNLQSPLNHILAMAQCAVSTGILSGKLQAAQSHKLKPGRSGSHRELTFAVSLQFQGGFTHGTLCQFTGDLGILIESIHDHQRTPMHGLNIPFEPLPACASKGVSGLLAGFPVLLDVKRASYLKTPIALAA